ncbi:MAG: alkaline phosphatase D family protein, partial [Synechococcus sp.]|nr:alkaline phosphatase D family protein [Synechococcus sp.]
LADPALVASYATRAGIAPPANQAAVPAFANALAPLVTQELVVATVQQAWGDPSRDMIGDSQLAWLQQQLASSTAAWQVLGQQTLMQSMAVPAELLLDPSNPALLDKYAAPLQKLATGTPFASLSAAEQALFAEAGKIPYNLDAWDGYGVERETILQTALTLDKRLISLNGDTHNAWAGVLDTMSAGSKPAGSLAGVEFATPGVTSPGLERILPGADAYIRARYPAVDGLDGLFVGYVNGLQYADLNRRGFLDLTVSKEQAVGTFQLLNGTDPLSGKPAWSSETVVSSASFALSTSAEARPLINWQPNWRELDLNFGLAFAAAGDFTRLDPAAYASVPRAGVQLADVQVQGSDADDRVVLGVGSTVNTGAGNDLLDNSDSQGGNLLVGGSGRDEFLLRVADDRVIGAELLADASSLGLPAVVGLADDQRDVFLVDSSNPAPEGTLHILDYELGRDVLLLDGIAPVGDWSSIRRGLQDLGISVNATPQLSSPLLTITLQPGVEVSYDLAAAATDPDGDPLQLLMLAGPSWISTSGTGIRATAAADLNPQQLNDLELRLAFSDGQAAIGFEPVLRLNAPPTALTLTNASTNLQENTSTARRIQLAEIEISDDGLGSNIITILGADADKFAVEGNKLFLQAGTSLDFETQSTYSIRVSARDAVLTTSPAVEASFTLTLSDVNEIPGISDLSTVVTVDLPGGGSRQLAVTFRDGDFSPGSSLAILSSLNINPKTLTDLAELGVRPSGGGVDFQLQVAPGQNQASLSSLIELVAADLLPDLKDAAGRRPARKLLYYGLNNTSGDVTALTYDPITGAGARFFDFNNDGRADYFSLSLIDGGYGDKDGQVNGVIDDPSFAGFADLNSLRFSTAAGGAVMLHDPGNAAPAAVHLRASLSSRPDSSNQIGYVVLNASELASADSLLTDLVWLRGRARTLFSTLEQTDVTLPSGTEFERDLQLINGQSLRFFEVVDASLDQLSSLSDSRFRLLAPDQLASDRVTVATASGSRFQLNLLAGDPGLNAMVAQAQALAPVLDLTPLTAAQTLQGTVRIAREADLSSVAGFYRSLDATGAVLAVDGITRLRPGDAGYAAAALRSTNVVSQLSDLAVADEQTSTRNFSGIVGGSFLAPFAQVNGNTFFAYAAANSDGISHFRSLGNNRFGLEDIRGGGDRDFDDLILAFDFTAVS